MTDSSAPSSSSRKRRTASIVQNINLDDVGPLTIQKRGSSSPREGGGPKAERKFEPGALEVNGALAGASRSPSTRKASLVTSRRRGSALWVQGVFAAAILAAACWVVFSPERHSGSPSLEQRAAKR